MHHRFKDLNQIKGIVSKIAKIPLRGLSEEVFGAFMQMNMEQITPIFTPETFVERTDKGDYCSNCGYNFQGEEESYNYCVNCLKELACCNNSFCDKDRERAEENVISFLRETYMKFRKN